MTNSTSALIQVAPFLVLILIPTLVVLIATRVQRSGLFSMGISLPWHWFSAPQDDGDGHTNGRKKRSHGSKSGRVRTRAEQLALRTMDHSDEDGFYPGLVNISGTYCFMNSTLQAMASLSHLQPHIAAIHSKAEAFDVPTPVIDALRDLFRRLNTPHRSYHAIRPTDLIAALTHHAPPGRANALLYSREHQDAQELFQLLSECIKSEALAVDREALRDRGLGALANVSPSDSGEVGKSVFDGLTANRRSCIVCGYTEAVMHFALDSWQLAVPRLTSSCHLSECLDDYTRIEILYDCVCRKCSIIATHRRLQLESASLAAPSSSPDGKPSPSRKRRLRDVNRMEARVRAAIDDGRIEDELKDVRMEKVVSTASTKQAMIARPPPVLALHINRSIHTGAYASKNTIYLVFPEVLDLTPYTTSGILSTVPTLALSTPPPAPSPTPRSVTPTPATYAPRTLYRLSAVVCHFGNHAFGHYVCYRRKPRAHAAPPRLVGVHENEYVWADEPRARPGRGWLRTSDDAVKECGIETVLGEGSGAFMLYYERVERVVQGERRICAGASSQETLRPREVVGGGVLGVGVREREEKEATPGPRVVRSVAARRTSVTPSAVSESLSSLPSEKEKETETPPPVMSASMPAPVTPEREQKWEREREREPSGARHRTASKRHQEHRGNGVALKAGLTA